MPVPLAFTGPEVVTATTPVPAFTATTPLLLVSVTAPAVIVMPVLALPPVAWIAAAPEWPP